ncbi:SDR family oxidoreductase [Paenibacillus ferrarius]|uniref:SDR family oxidoreductase n=1 Tax=Paenibacillus ferrarius TaxID=1469647 RepID=UPI003D2E5CED
MQSNTKTVVITGATSGIGYNTALHFADKGYRVIGIGRRADRLRALELRLMEAVVPGSVYEADVCRYEELQHVVEDVEARYGAIHVWINNAGVNRAIGPTWEISPEDWAADLNTNLLGTFHGVRAVLPLMLRQRLGRIINMVGGGTTHSMMYSNAYGTAKTAVARLTENVAEELEKAEPAIKVFAMNPGLNDSQMTRTLRSSELGRKYFPEMEKWLQNGATEPHEAPACAYRIAEGMADAYHGCILTIYDTLDDLLPLPKDKYKLRMR